MSEIALPRTWRPLGTRIAGIAAGLLLLAFVVATWLLFDDQVRDDFTLLQRVTAVAMGMLIFACVHALVRPRAVATERGLVVVNGYKKREFEWAEVVAVHLPRGAPWATLDLADGTTCAVMAMQGSDGARAKKAVRELRSVLAATTRSQ